VASEEQIERYSAVFSKGLASARKETAYRAIMDAAPRSWRPLYEFGERRHCSFEMARAWLLHGMPRYDIPHRYVLFKPLSKTEPDDDIRVVIFPVNPLELSGLLTLLGSVVEDTDPLQAPQGPDCFRLTGFAYLQHDAQSPKAVLGMLDVDGRELMHKRYRDDILTLAIPMPLFQRMEREADQSVFQIPGWRKLRSRRQKG
jgi:hypothetical protein